MTFEFRPAVRDKTSLLIGIAGPSGSGKTYSALRLGRGLVGEKEALALIDTEAGRALHYAELFDFDHGDLKPPFAPDAYTEAIVAADQAGYAVIVVDSVSHEWEGDGGCLDFHEAELERMAGGDLDKRERVKFAAWIKPKGQHKRFVARLLQCRAHLILCLRAEEKVKIAQVEGKDGRKRSEFVNAGWQPLCEKRFMFEMTCSFMLTDEAPGVPRPIKLQEQHKSAFAEGQQISEVSGRTLAEWAAGKSAPSAVSRQPSAKKQEAAAPADLSTEASVRAKVDAWAIARDAFADDKAWAEEYRRLLKEAVASAADVDALVAANKDELELLKTRSAKAAAYLENAAAERRKALA